jgi:hypothetical protein
MEHMTINELLQRWSDGSLNSDQLRALTEKLAERENQDALIESWLIESSLPDCLPAPSVTAPHKPVPIHINKQSASLEEKLGTNWLSFRPLTAAAAGIVFGMLSAALVFGYSTPRILQQVLTLTNPGFEEAIAPIPDGIPLHFGVWSGDYSETVGEQQGITPHEGKRMFHFQRSDSRDGFPSRAYHGNMYQFIDIRPWHEAISTGAAVVDWSAWFNCIREQVATPSQFEASMWAFSGEPSFVRKNWEKNLHQELGYSTWRVVADDDPKTWQRVTGSLIVPPETSFLVVELKAIAGNETPVDGVVTFAGHYADDVQMVLRTNAREVQRARP